jgi:membrane-bound serine protease (ClpP class)
MRVERAATSAHAFNRLRDIARGLPTETMLPNWRQRLLSVIANPSFALILMMIGIYGLIFESSSPGFGLPGTVGAICLLLALFALQLLPVNYAGLGLIVIGIALLTAELLSPSFSVLGVGGVIAFIASGLLLFDRNVPGFGVPMALVVALAASSAAVVLLEAAQILAQQPEAMQLRYLQTMTQVAGDRASTIVFPLPMDLLGRLLDKKPEPH